MVSAILLAWTSPAEPPATVKSWLAKCTIRPSTRAPPGNHAIGGQFLLRHAEVLRPVRREESRLLESIGVEQQCETFAGRQLSGVVLLFDPLCSTSEFHALFASFELG